MILSDREMKAIRQSLDEHSGLDEELLTRCGDFLYQFELRIPHIDNRSSRYERHIEARHLSLVTRHLVLHTGKYDEAVRNAFILLEERLRTAVNKEGMTGSQLANYAFSAANGPLARLIGNNESEREGLRELYSGAFKLFRNPTAHGVVGYDQVEGKSILGLVNLLLKILNKVGEVPPPNTFSEQLEATLIKMEKTIGAAATSRLRRFLWKCMTSGVKPATTTQQWVWLPFRRHALMQYENWPKAKPYPLTIFYFVAQEQGQYFWVPVNQYYSKVVGLDLNSIKRSLRALEFQPSGKLQDYRIDIKTNLGVQFFDDFFDLVQDVSAELETLLDQSL
jgi:uncharacterized protein (TIGR02391 family)